MVAKKKILISLTEEEQALLDSLRGEFFGKGIKISQSDLVAMALRELRAKGGVVVEFRKQNSVGSEEKKDATPSDS